MHVGGFVPHAKPAVPRSVSGGRVGIQERFTLVRVDEIAAEFSHHRAPVTVSAESFKAYVEDQLRGFPGVSLRAMFGGFGIYRGERFFGILHRGRFYLLTDDASQTRYREHGMKPFKPSAKQVLKNYFEVPLAVLDDPETLTAWAQEAATLAVIKKTKKVKARKRHQCPP
jgi:DNA transformation protein